MNSGLRPRPLSALWGEERKKGPQVKISLLRFCEDLFVCLFSFVATDVFTSFQYAASEKERKVPFDLILLCSATMSKDCTLYSFIHLRNDSLLLHANTMISITYPLRKYFSPFQYVSSFEGGWLGERFKRVCVRAENIEEILSYLCLKNIKCRVWRDV